MIIINMIILLHAIIFHFVFSRNTNNNYLYLEYYTSYSIDLHLISIKEKIHRMNMLKRFACLDVQINMNITLYVNVLNRLENKKGTYNPRNPFPKTMFAISSLLLPL